MSEVWYGSDENHIRLFTVTVHQGLLLKQKPVKVALGIPETAHLQTMGAPNKLGFHPTDLVEGKRPTTTLSSRRTKKNTEPN